MDPSETPTMRYDAFLCHRRQDGWRLARWLRRRIERYRLPKSVPSARPGPLVVFLDRAYEGAAKDYWSQRLVPALDASRRLLVLWTPGAGRRREGADVVWDEITHFVDRHGMDRVLLVLAAGDLVQACPAELRQRFPRLEFRDIRRATIWRWLWLPHLLAVEDEIARICGALFEVSTEHLPALIGERRNRLLVSASVVGIALVALVVLITSLSMNLAAAKQRVTENLALGMAEQALTMSRQDRHDVAGVFLAAADDLLASPRWAPLSILVGVPITERGPRIALRSPIRHLASFVDGRGDMRVFVVDDSGAWSAAIESMATTPQALSDTQGFTEWAVSPTGRWIAARDAERVRVWHDGRAPRTWKLDVSTGGSDGLAAHPTLDRLAIAVQETIQIRDLDGALLKTTSPVVRDWDPDPDQLAKVAFSADGKAVASWRRNGGEVVLWDADTGELRTTLRTTADYAGELAIDPFGKWLATGSMAGILEFWNATGDRVTKIDTKQGWIADLAFSPTGQTLAVGLAYGVVELWNTRGALPVRSQRLELSSHSVRQVVFSPDATQLLARDDQGHVETWHVDEDRMAPVSLGVRELPRFDATGNRAVLAATSGSIWASTEIDPRVVRRTRAANLLAIPYQDSGPGFDPMPTRVIESGSPATNITLPRRAQDPTPVACARVAIAADGTTVVGVDHGRLLTWSVDRRAVVNERALGERVVDSLAIHGERIAILFEDGTVELAPWTSSAAAIPVGTAAGDAMHEANLTFTRDGRHLWVQRGRTTVFDVASQPAVTVTPPTGHEFDSIDAATGVVLLHSPTTWQAYDLTRRCLLGEPIASTGVAAVHLGPRARRLAVEHETPQRDVRQVRMIDVDGANTPLEVAARRFLAFDPSGSLAVFETASRRLDFWDLERGSPCGSLELPIDVDRVAFAPNGRTLVGDDGAQAIWLQGIDVSDRQDVERRAGFSLDRMTPRIALPAPTPDPRIERLDPLRAAFWHALRATFVNLASAEASPETVAPLRAWCTAHADPRHRAAALTALERLLE